MYSGRSQLCEREYIADIVAMLHFSNDLSPSPSFRSATDRREVMCCNGHPEALLLLLLLLNESELFWQMRLA
ncbi:hypothetical protein ZHAS_00009770 [Anopheles sinensis]|uniref:Uncharacterized protein n=1 Tax=Anopheles sinensis TaxID=74873 RepID=A0A084VVW5_ANOSI|nr:hypothetical protein ZHAS_00009770 [Anopheles sinensis]